MGATARRRGPGRRIIVVVVAVVALVAAFLLWSRFRTTPIGDIVSDPGKYDGKVVRIAGRVANSASILGFGAFEVEDDTGKIWVHKQGAVPSDGSQVRVRGRVNTLLQIGDLSVVGLEALD